MKDEWMPLWVAPAVPVPPGITAHAAVHRSFPGDISDQRIITYRRLRAVLLAPHEDLTSAEGKTPPIPLVVLHRMCHAPRIGRRGSPRVSSMRQATYCFATSRGFDHYRLENRRLVDVWSNPHREEGAVAVDAQGYAGRARLPRQHFPRGGTTERLLLLAVTGVLLLLAAVLPPVVATPSGQPSPQQPEGARISRILQTSAHPAVPPGRSRVLLEEIAVLLPDARLLSMEALPATARYTFWAPATAGAVMQAMTSTAHTWEVREHADRSTELIVEVNHEQIP